MSKMAKVVLENEKGFFSLTRISFFLFLNIYVHRCYLFHKQNHFQRNDSFRLNNIVSFKLTGSVRVTRTLNENITSCDPRITSGNDLQRTFEQCNKMQSFLLKFLSRFQRKMGRLALNDIKI